MQATALILAPDSRAAHAMRYTTQDATAESLPTSGATSPSLVIDGDTAQLHDLLVAIVEHEKAARAATISLDLAREAAASIMLALGQANNVSITHDGVPYAATVERYKRTICACHTLDPWDCPDRKRGIVLTETPRTAATYVRVTLPASGRYDGRKGTR